MKNIFVIAFVVLSLNVFAQKPAAKEQERETTKEIGDSLLDVIDNEFETATTYHDDGAKKSEGKILRFGKWTYFHPNGKVELEGNFKANKKDSIWLRFDEEGNKLVSGNFSNGVKNGLWTIYFPNGKKHYEVTFVNGKLNGKVQAWHETGILFKEEAYVNGSKEGLFKHGTTQVK
ncbi:MAG: toxin-antitoxin system YwqK family antitoxin [Flavobacteriales bacterium]